MCDTIQLKGSGIMPASKAQQKAVNKYMSANYDRVNLTMPKGSKDALKAHAESTGESVNAFINRAIMEVTEMDNMHKAYQRSLLRHLERMQNALDGNDITEAKKLLTELIEDTKADVAD